MAAIVVNDAAWERRENWGNRRKSSQVNFFPLCFFFSFFFACSLALDEWEKARKTNAFCMWLRFRFCWPRVIVVVVLDVADFAEINIILSLSWRASFLKAGVWRQLTAVCRRVRVYVCARKVMIMSNRCPSQSMFKHLTLELMPCTCQVRSL